MKEYCGAGEILLISIVFGFASLYVLYGIRSAWRAVRRARRIG